MEEIIIEIGPDGNVQIDARGFSGAECEAATKALEEAVGEVTARAHKPEYRESARRVRPAAVRR